MVLSSRIFFKCNFTAYDICKYVYWKINPLAYRYMMQWPGGRILQRHELDAFLAQAVSNQLYEPDQLQELKVGV